MIRIASFSCAALMFLTGTLAALANQSVYTKIEWKTGCMTIDRSNPDEGGSWARLKCRGYKAYAIRVDEDDARMSVHFGPTAEQPGWESFTSFNGVGKVVEWRLRGSSNDATPIAAILRWYVTRVNTDHDRQVLVISTVANGQGRKSCVAGYVDASATPRANRVARRIADTVVARFECGHDTPVFHGETRASTPRPTRSGRARTEGEE